MEKAKNAFLNVYFTGVLSTLAHCYNVHASTQFTSQNLAMKAVKSLCGTNQALCHEGLWGSGCINPHFLDLGTSWR
jgi:hypothetical protein